MDGFPLELHEQNEEFSPSFSWGFAREEGENRLEIRRFLPFADTADITSLETA